MAVPRRKVIKHLRLHLRLVEGLRRLREDEGRTQGEVAQALNLSRSQYTALESGRSMLSFDQLCSLSQFYGTTLCTLLELCGVA